VDTGGDVDKQKKNAIHTIIEVLEADGVNRSMIKVLRQGKIIENGFFVHRTLRKFGKKAIGEVEYLSIKVTLHSLNLAVLLTSLEECVDDLEHEYVCNQLPTCHKPSYSARVLGREL
jgi:hypothetical protein